MAAATLHVLVELETMAGVSMVTATEGKTILTTMPSKGCYREPTRTWVRLHQCTNRPAILVRSSKEGEGVRVGDDGDVDAYNTVRDVQHLAITTPLRRERCHAQHHDGTRIAEATIHSSISHPLDVPVPQRCHRISLNQAGLVIFSLNFHVNHPVTPGPYMKVLGGGKFIGLTNPSMQLVVCVALNLQLHF